MNSFSQVRFFSDDFNHLDFATMMSSCRAEGVKNFFAFFVKWLGEFM